MRSTDHWGKAMANYPQELAQDAVCQSRTGHMTGLWFLPTRPLRLNTNEWMYRSLSSSLCSSLHSPVTSSLLGPNILLNILLSNTLSLRSSLNVSDQISHRYKTKGQISVHVSGHISFNTLTVKDSGQGLSNSHSFSRIRNPYKSVWSGRCYGHRKALSCKIYCYTELRYLGKLAPNPKGYIKFTSCIRWNLAQMKAIKGCNL